MHAFQVSRLKIYRSLLKAVLKPLRSLRGCVTTWIGVVYQQTYLYDRSTDRHLAHVATRTVRVEHL